MPIMVKYSTLKEPKKIESESDKVIKAIDKKWIENDPDHLVIFNGVTFP